MNAVSILRSADELPDATMAQLVATYNALTGRTPTGEGVQRSITKFESREVGKRRVEQAMMVAKDADAHLGVAKGASGEVKTAEELAVKAAEGDKPAPEVNPTNTVTFPDGTLANALQKQAQEAPGPIAPRPRAEAVKREPGAPRRGSGTSAFVKRTPEGTAKTKVRPDSARGVVLAALDSIHGKSKNPAVAIAKITEHVGDGVGVPGAIQKLVELGHLEFCREDGSALAPAGAAAAPAPAPAEAPAA